ncbi:MAG: translocation/assembly module TamB domain-containing protein [Leptolyngbyaceae cyanobacterium]
MSNGLNEPDPVNDEPENNRPDPEEGTDAGPRRRWGRTFLILGSAGLLGAAGGAWWAWSFANNRLAPWASELLTETLGRPVELGPVERVSPFGVEFGPSAIPATATDPDEVSIEEINVSFNPLQLLRRRIRPEITLQGVNAYLEQNETGEWVDLSTLDLPEGEPGKDPLIQVNPIIRIEDTVAILQPYSEPDADPIAPLVIEDVTARVAISKLENFALPDQPGERTDVQQIDLALTASPQDAGTLSLQGEVLQFPEEVPEQPGIPSANAVDRLAGNLSLQIQDLDLPAVAPAALANLPQSLPLTVTAGQVHGNVDVELAPQTEPRITGTARLEDGSIAVEPLSEPIEAISGQLRFQGNRIALEDGNAQYGELVAKAGGLIDTRNGYDLTAEIEPFTVAELVDGFPIDLPVETTGTFRAEGAVTGPLAEPEITGRLVSVDTVTVDKVAFALVEAAIAYTHPEVTLTDLQLEPLAGGSVTGSGNYTLGDPGRLALQVTGRRLPADAIAGAYGLPEAISIGTLSLDGEVSGPLDNLSGDFAWQAPDGTYPTRGLATLERNQITLREAIVQVAGGTVVATGTLANRAWNADIVAEGIQLGAFNDSLQGSAVDGTGQFSGTLDDLTLAGIRGSGTVGALLAGGTLVSDFNLANGNWQASGEGRGIQLGLFSPDLQGAAAATFQLAGNVDDLTLAGIRGDATVTLSEGLATVARLRPQLAGNVDALVAQVSWDGQVLNIDQASTAGFFAQGTVRPLLSGPGAPSIDAINLLLRADNYDLATLPLPVSNGVNLRGLANFTGSLTGNLSDINLIGDLSLANLAVNELMFEPLLAGDVRFSSRDGAAVNLLGDQDQIVATYASRSNQVNFRVQAAEAVAIGETEGDRLQARLYNFPLSLVGLPQGTAAQYGTLRGTVQFASATINLRDFSAVGQFDVNDLGLGYISVDRVFSGFSYSNGVATLSQGEIRMVDETPQGEILDERIYQVAGQFGFARNPQLQASLLTERGTLQDLLAIFKVAELMDLNRGLTVASGLIPESQAEVDALLATVPVETQSTSFLNRIRRLSEIRELQFLEEVAAEEALLPPLEELNGLFRGRIDVAASLPRDITVDFNLQGQDWRWGNEFVADQVTANGRLQDGVLQLNPVRFETDLGGERTAFISLSGETALDSRDNTRRRLTLDVENVPVAALEKPLRIPFPIAGDLNGQAVMVGNLSDPVIEGNLTLDDGLLNDNAIDQAVADFEYRAARLSLNSSLNLIDSNDPLTLVVRAPYQLPFVKRPPASDELFVDIDGRDDGIALLNLFNDQVAWESGTGAVDVSFEGTWDQQSIPDLSALTGQVFLSEAVISFTALPEPLTDVDGRIQLSPENIIVESFTGQFSEGKVTAWGTLPTLIALPAPADPAEDSDETVIDPSSPEFDPSTLPTQPLTVALDDIDLNLRGLYAGQVDGLLRLGGSLLVFGPRLTGEIALSNGQITIPNLSGNANQTRSDDNSLFPSPRFDDLAVTLNDNVTVVQGGILSVTARGSLLVNGGIRTPRPLGLINLTSGRVALLTTSLRLTGDGNRAEFRDSFDPLLNVTLTTSIPDTGDQAQLTTGSPFPRRQVADQENENFGLTQGGVRSIRIRAEVNAPASQLLAIEGIEGFRRLITLTSTPQRSETEIFSLLSGDVFALLGSTVSGEGSANLGGIAGSVLLNALQNTIGDRLPLSEFRLFPVNTDAGQVNDSFDIGGEVGVNVSSRVSVSVLKVLTNDTPFQFSARYRITDQFTLRGTTSYEDFRERSGLLLEYETRF